MTNFIWHNQTKRIKVFSQILFQISVTHLMSTFSFDTVEIDYSTFFFSFLIWKSISGVNTSEVFYTKIVNPFFQIEIGKRFIYKMLPMIGIALNGLFFPNNNPLPFFSPFPVFFPIPIVSLRFP